MRSYNNIFESIASPEALFRAWDEFKRGKRAKKDVLAFEKNLEPNVFELHRDLTSKRYRHGPYTDFYITDPKLRHIHKAVVRDRILHHAIFAALNPLFEPTFIANSFSCRVDKGTHGGVEALAKMLRKVGKNSTLSCYVLKCDIRKFFDSIDQEILLGILRKRITDQGARWLLDNVISSYAAGLPREREREREEKIRQQGLPIGNLTSQLFANVYMNEFDQFVKHELRVKHYARYTDDFVIVGTDPDALMALLPSIRGFLRERLRLDLHPDKVEIRRYSKGVDFLGYVAFPHFRLLRKKTEKRMWRKLEHVIAQYKGGAADEERARAALNSYLGILSHADAYRLGERLKNNFWIRMNG